MANIYHFVLKSPKHNKPILLDLSLSEPEKPQPLVVLVHGFKSFKDWGAFPSLAAYFAERGYAFARFSFSHNGTSPEAPLDFPDLDAFGNNNFEIELDDLAVVIDALAQQHILKPTFLGLIGHSRGGGVALLKAAEDQRVQAVATWASIADMRMNFDKQDIVAVWKKNGVVYVPNTRTNQEMPLYFQLYENTIRNWARLDLASLLPKMTQPVLAFHGSADKTVPESDAHLLKKYQPAIDLRIIAEADHTFGIRHPHTGVWTEHFQTVVDETFNFFEQSRMNVL